MKFIPKSEREIAIDGLFEKGDYQFEVIKAEEKISKSKNPMIEMRLAIFPGDPDAAPRSINDYLLEAFAIKLRHFCQVTGLIEIYESGNLTAEDCVGKTGTCRIIVKEDKSGQYQPQNSVADYISPETASVPKSASTDKPKCKPAADLEDDDIPF